MNKGPTSISALMTEPLFAAAQVSQLRLIDGRQSVPTCAAMAHPFSQRPEPRPNKQSVHRVHSPAAEDFNGAHDAWQRMKVCSFPQPAGSRVDGI